MEPYYLFQDNMETVWGDSISL